MSLLIKNGLVVTETEVLHADLLVEGERIAKIGGGLPDTADTVIDAAGKILLPGAIDSHVHFYMKTAAGRNADDFTAGSACAICGGTTTVVDFAGPVEGAGFAQSFRLRKAEADGNIHTDYALHMEVTGEFEQDYDDLASLLPEGVRALKIYTTYGASRVPDEKLPALFQKAAELGLIMLAHCEDDELVTSLKREFIAEGKTQARFHGDSRPVEAETKSIEKIMTLAHEANMRLIIAHISSGKGGRLVQAARARGWDVSGETCPHYLLLTDERYLGENPQRFIMTPPLRKAEDNEQLWKLVTGGDVGMISTDHCPFTLTDKLSKEGCFEAIPGIGGCESMVSLLFSEGYAKGRLTLNELASRLSTQAAKLYGLYPKKGVLAEGADADIVIIDPDVDRTLSAKTEHSSAGYTVYEGFAVKGKPVYTILRGEIAAKDGELTAKECRGQYVKAL